MLSLKEIMLVCGGLLLSTTVFAGNLAIVIDDFGYRPRQENQILQWPNAISVAVLPDAPHARAMATKAHQRGHEVLIHLPMAPVSKQPLEKNTLQPDMTAREIEQIIRQAIDNVPYAVGVNNHMGSKMTASLSGMQKVMQVLARSDMYFLDSVTTGNSQVSRAAEGTSVKVLKRRVFLDDSQDEAAIRKQFLRAIQLARREGNAIAIGHPHPSTVKVLDEMLASLPPDIKLVTPGQITSGKFSNHRPPVLAQKQKFDYRGQVCKPEKPLPDVSRLEALEIIVEGIKQSDFIQKSGQLF